MSVFIVTQRCVIRPMSLDDVVGIFELDSDPQVLAYLDQPVVDTLEKAKDMVAFIVQQYQDFGIARWAIHDKVTQEFIGWTGFKFMPAPMFGRVNYIDFGYRLKRKFWGQGLGLETAQAALEYGITTLNYKEVFASAHQQNKGSDAILTKLGFKVTASFLQGQEPQNWYELIVP